MVQATAVAAVMVKADMKERVLIFIIVVMLLLQLLDSPKLEKSEITKA